MTTKDKGAAEDAGFLSLVSFLHPARAMKAAQPIAPTECFGA